MFNTKKYIEGGISKELILSHVTQEDIFEKYLGFTPEFGIKFINPYRDDNFPNSGFYETESGVLRFKDFTGFCNWSCFDLVMYVERLNFPNALTKIAMDFGIISEHKLLQVEGVASRVNNVKRRRSVTLQIASKPFTPLELEWWRGYGIRPSTLSEYNVKSVDTVWFNGRPSIKSTKLLPIYSYEFDAGIYKTYSPNRSEFKWFSNCKSHHYQGFDQLNWFGDLLIITKSLKDVMVLREMGYDAIAPHTEHAKIPWDFIQKLKKRFPRIVIFFDNDEAGTKGSELLSSYHSLQNIMIPTSLGVKDISDYVKSNNLEKGKILMNKILG